MKSLITILFAVLLAGCGTLDKNGPYNGDKFLYNTDLAITASYDVMQTFVAWEKTNRKLINNADVSKAASTIRSNAKQWISSAIALRDAYEFAPTVENREALSKALAVLREAVTQASVYMVKATEPKE